MKHYQNIFLSGLTFLKSSHLDHRIIVVHMNVLVLGLSFWPHRFTYKELSVATSGFRDENVLGKGASAKNILHGNPN
jgi:hypothetical protein